MENSREMIKLVDYFVSQNSSVISEKLVSAVITLLDQMRAFDSKAHPNSSITTLSSPSSSFQASSFNESRTSSASDMSRSSQSVSSPSMLSSVLGSYGIVHDEWAETCYLGMNILVNALSSTNIEICAQASAKINTILHSRSIVNCEEACFLIASVEKVMYESLKESKNFLMKKKNLLKFFFLKLMNNILHFYFQ